MSKRNSNSQRFDWKGASREEAAAELLRRNIKRYTTKDETLPCFICGAKHIRRNNYAYKPSAGTSAHNQVVAHADCVERVAAGGSPSSKPLALVTNTVSKPASNGGQPVLKGDVGSDYFSGWAAGVRLAFDKEQPQVLASPDYLRGLSDGVAYAAQHGA